MDNPKNTQIEELEALESIYSESELNIICREYRSISLEVKTTIDSIYDIQPIILKCKLPPDYPNVVPEIEVSGLPDDDLSWADMRQGVLKELNNVALDNVGMSMVFTLVAALQDYVTNELENKKENAVKAEEQRKHQAEMIERARFEDSRLTVDQFNKWRTEFMKYINAKKDAELKAKEQTDRLTGKQLFLRDKSLNVSDLQFINENDLTADNVEDIDASLFEEDIDDDTDDDDESYECPN